MMSYFQAADHLSVIKSELRGLMFNESYWNIMIFCRDGTVAHNRMLVGLVFPQVSDEISVICPDHDMEDIAEMINNVLQSNEEQERPLTNSREKLVFSHVYDTDTSIFQPDQASSGSEENNWHDPLETPDQDPLESVLSIESGNDENNIQDIDEQKPICDLDNLILHLESIKRKSPPKKKKRANSRKGDEELIDQKPVLGVNDNVTVRSLLDEMIDKVDRNEVPLSNLVFSTLGCPTDTEETRPDDLSAYLESSSSESSRAPSPDHCSEQDIIFDENEPLDFSSNMMMSDDNENLLVPNLTRKCRVNIERLKLTQVHRSDIHFYLNKPAVNTNAIMSQLNSKMRKKVRENKRILRSIKSVHSKKSGNINRVKRVKKWRCGNCKACLRPDCRKCIFCLDKKKYGGLGVKKQSCMERPDCVRLRSRSKTPSLMKRNTKSVIIQAQKESKTEGPSVEVRSARRQKSPARSEHRRNSSSSRSVRLSRPGSPSERPKLNKYATVNGAEDLLIRKNKMDQIKEKFKLQEKALKEGKTSLLNLSKEELLFEMTVNLLVGEHRDSLRQQLLELLNHQPLFNVTCRCSDKQVNYNRLAVGLLFPQLQDQDLVLCPDFTSTELSETLQKTLSSNEDKGNSFSVEEHQEDEESDESADQRRNDSSSESEHEPFRHRVSRRNPTRKNIRQISRSMKQKLESSGSSTSGEEEDDSQPISNKNGLPSNNKSAARKTLKSRKSILSKRRSGGRKGRCMSCSSCLKPDCRKCKYCTDMKKYGGPGVKKQSCEFRPKCVANQPAQKREKVLRGETARSSSDLDEVESMDVPADLLSKAAGGEIRSGDTTGQDQAPLSPTSSSHSSFSQQSSPVKLSNEDEINCAKTTELKCIHCEFIGKTESGLKKHTVRYHRSFPGTPDSRDPRSDLDSTSSGVKRKIVLDTWQLNCPAEDINNCQKKQKPTVP